MNKIFRIFQQLFCKHESAELIRWHWTHGINGNEPAFIEGEYRCYKCGKTVYLYQHGETANEWARIMGDYKRIYYSDWEEG